MPRDSAYQFTPRKNFNSPEFNSSYIKGLTYTVKPDNDKLHAAVQQWVAEGKVVIGAPTSKAVAKVKGTGTVS